jgi:homoserine dehydrogenase
MASPLKIGIAGLGTVGASVVRLIEQQREALAARCGRPIEVVAVSARSRGKKRDLGRKKLRWVADPVSLSRPWPRRITSRSISRLRSAGPSRS